MPDLWPWLVLAAVLAYVPLAWLFPPLLRPLFWTLAHATYRFRIYHAERIPAAGPVLIVSNHVTYVDWLLLWVACPRPVTFVLWTGFYKNPVARFFLSYVRHRSIAIDDPRKRPHATIAALKQITAALDAGRAVIVFAEQALTRNGEMLPFHRGIEHVLRHAQQSVPIVPVYLENLWGSIFSWERGRIIFKWPLSFRRRIAAYFGEPLPAISTAAQVRLAVQECNADCARRQSDFLLPADRQFVRNASRWRLMFCTAYVDAATGTERKLAWGKVLVGAWCLTRWLRSRLGPEPHVGVWLPSGMGSALTNLALTFLGKVPINLNYTAGLDPVLSATRQAGITTVLTSTRFLQRMPLELPDDIRRISLEEALASISGRERLLKFLAVLLLPGWLLDRLIGLCSQLDDVLTILFSSGSTGEPKGIMLSHRNVRANTISFITALNLQPRDRMLATLPFFHTFGYTVCFWAPALAPLGAVYFPDPRQAKEIGELCKKHACTIMLGTATFLRIYLRRSEAEDFRSLRLLICGAEKLPVKLSEEFRAKFGVLPLEGYGCTELSPVVSTNIPDVTVGGVRQKGNEPGTVGQPIPGVAVRAFDPETFAPLPPEADGVLLVKGPNVMQGYLHLPEKTRQVVRDGWYVTGDMGRVEAHGFIRITGRLNRFAKIGGEMVPLERLDEEMHDILGSCGERVLTVAAVPDEKRGERVVVLYLPEMRERLPAVFEQLRERGLPNLWIPDIRDCYPMEAFPVLGSGKLDLREVGILAKRLAKG